MFVFIFCFVAAISDLLHDQEAIDDVYLLLIASEFFSEI